MLRPFPSLIGALLLPAIVLAQSFGIGHLPYSDVSTSSDAAVAISTLTEAGIVEGNPDGTFRPQQLLNRAEFVKIAMGLLDAVPAIGFASKCFPDVPLDEWYSQPVCLAKFLGIIEGNAQVGVSPDKWRFAPERPVQYEEAVKILVGILGLPTVKHPGEEWYQAYLRSAATYKIDLNLKPGRQITRAEMARLAARSYAHREGQLDAFLDAEEARTFSRHSSSKSSSPRSSSRSSSVSSVSTSRSSSSSSVLYDPYGDTSMRSSILLLGEVSPVLAAVEIFSDAEPLRVTTITITLQSAVSSINNFLVYDEFGKFLGRATKGSSGNEYELPVRTANLVVGKREPYSIYVRAELRPYSGGGTSGQNVRVLSITIEGDGDWSNRQYTQGSSETFELSETARSTITVIERTGFAEDILLPGEDQRLASFNFSGKTNDGAADVLITALSFTIEKTGNVTLSNVELGAEGTSVRHSCTTGASTVTCSGIPASFGSVEDTTRELRLYGDVSFAETVQNASLRLTLNQPGSPGSAGAVTWNDGSSTFEWVPFDQPVARGTYFSR